MKAYVLLGVLVQTWKNNGSRAPSTATWCCTGKEGGKSRYGRKIKGVEDFKYETFKTTVSAYDEPAAAHQPRCRVRGYSMHRV